MVLDGGVGRRESESCESMPPVPCAPVGRVTGTGLSYRDHIIGLSL